MFRGWLINTINDAFEIALNDMQWCAKFVGDVGGQVAALLVRTLQFTDHFIEALEQFAEHV